MRGLGPGILTSLAARVHIPTAFTQVPDWVDCRCEDVECRRGGSLGYPRCGCHASMVSTVPTAREMACKAYFCSQVCLSLSILGHCSRHILRQLRTTSDSEADANVRRFDPESHKVADGVDDGL